MLFSFYLNEYEARLDKKLIREHRISFHILYNIQGIRKKYSFVTIIIVFTFICFYFRVVKSYRHKQLLQQ